MTRCDTVRSVLHLRVATSVENARCLISRITLATGSPAIGEDRVLGACRFSEPWAVRHRAIDESRPLTGLLI
jgi:hypothetical protein